MRDEELVLQAQSGDPHAFGQLVDLHQKRIYGTLAKMTGDRDEAMDLTQDTFIRAWQQLGSFQRRSAFSTWLYRIAVRVAYDSLRQERRRDDRKIVEHLVDRRPGPDHEVVSVDETERLRRRIDELPKMQRAVVILRAYDELSYREIAEILETTENSARVSFHHAITRMRERYAKEATAE